MREAQAALDLVHSKVRLTGITAVRPLLAPDGHLSLPPAGFRLIAASDGFCSFLWRGAVEFDLHRAMPVRILGRYQAETLHFVAKRDLQRGDVLGARDFEKITEPGCSSGSEFQVSSPEGSVMRQALNKGDEIRAAMFSAPTVVEEGAAVRVTATTGGASVSIEAIAEKPGRRGESVFVQSKSSGKRIRVLLTGKGEASAVVAGATR